MAMLIGPGPDHCSTPKARSSPLKFRIEYLVLALGKETAAHTVVGTVVSSQMPTSREMRARGYALHAPNFPSFLIMNSIIGESADYAFAHPNIFRTNDKFLRKLLQKM